MNFTQEEDNVLSYITLSLLYLNDLVCNAIRDLEPHVANKDKETKKIYGALKKRAVKYLNQVNTMMKPDIYRLAFYFSYMDDLCEESLREYAMEIRAVFDKYDVNDPIYLSQVEIIRCLADKAVLTNKYMVEYARKVTPKALKMSEFRLDDIKRVANNFAFWAYRHIETSEPVNFNNEEKAYEAFSKLCKVLISPKSHEAAITYADNEEEKRLKENIN